MQHGGKAAYRNLEAVQDKASNQLLGASRSVAGAAAGGDLGWKKLEEGREVKKLMYGKRLEGLEDNRLVKTVAEKLKDAGNVGWWGVAEKISDHRRGLSKKGVEGKSGRRQ